MPANDGPGIDDRIGEAERLCVIMVDDLATLRLRQIWFAIERRFGGWRAFDDWRADDDAKSTEARLAAARKQSAEEARDKNTLAAAIDASKNKAAPGPETGNKDGPATT